MEPNRSECDYYLGRVRDALSTSYNELANVIDFAEGHELYESFMNMLNTVDSMIGNCSIWRTQLQKEIREKREG